MGGVPLSDSYILFREGIELERADRGEEAIARLLAASRLAPRNAVIRMRIGNLQMKNGDFQKALETYLHVVNAWPLLAMPRYRLAALLSFEDDLSQHLENTSAGVLARVMKGMVAARDNARSYLRARPSPRQLLIELYSESADRLGVASQARARRAEILAAKSADTWPSPTPLDMLRLASEQWAALETLTLRGVVLRRELRDAGFKRMNFLAVAVLADYCTQLQLRLLMPAGGSSVRDLDQVSRIVAKPGLHWVARYNAACFFALSITEPDVEGLIPSSEWVAANNRPAMHAVHELQRLLYEPAAVSTIESWVLPEKKGDPDLRCLRLHPLFHRWKSQLRADLGVIVADSELPDPEENEDGKDGG